MKARRGLFLLPASIVLIAATTVARITGAVVSVDPKGGTVLIHHEAFALMPMSMTMMMRPARRGDLAKLHPGDRVTATVDTATDPWTVSNIVRISAKK